MNEPTPELIEDTLHKRYDKILANIIENAFKEGYTYGRQNFNPYDFYWKDSIAKQSADLLRNEDESDKDK